MFVTSEVFQLGPEVFIATELSLKFMAFWNMLDIFVAATVFQELIF